MVQEQHSSAARIHLSLPFPEPPSPSLFTLRLVQIVTRHGERSPMKIPFKSYPFSMGELGFCSQSPFLSHLHPAAHEEDPEKELARAGKFRLVFQDRMRSYWMGSCGPGELTDQGKESMFKLGRKLHEAYVKRLAFLGPAPDREEVEIRSTDIPRAVDSARNLIQGLFPLWAEGKVTSAHFVDIAVREEKTEYLYPNFNACRKLKRDFYDANGRIRKSQAKEIEELAKEASGALEGKEKDSSLVHSIYDSIACAEAHGLALPETISPEMFRKAEDLIAAQWWNPFVESENLRRLATGLLLREVVGAIQDNVSENTKKKFLLFSSHDSMIAPLLTAFQIYNGRWPPFSSHIIIELYQKKASPQGQALPPSGKEEEEKRVAIPEKQHFVRMIYNSQVKKLPACEAEAVEDGTLCPLESFLKITQRLIPENYKEECRLD